jgi:hypothetical protein
MKTQRLIILIVILQFCSSLLHSQQNGVEKRIFTTKRVAGESPLINGSIDEAVWDLVDWSGNFIQHEPDNGAAPSQQTAVKILYDDDNLYVAIRAFDTEPEKIVKRMSRRDGFDGDWVEINIDSYFDKRTAFSFTASVSGVKGDEAITNNGENWDPTWDPIWYVKTSVDSLGWIAEMRIPFTSLRFSNNKEKQVWGIQVNRRFYRNQEKSTWQHVPREASGWVHNFGELHGISGIKPKRNIEVSPYFLSKLLTYEKDHSNPFLKGKEFGYGVGLDGKIGVTNDFTLDFTINPDFGQVEADPSQVNLTAFETYYPEKRPFFIEGRSITNFQISNGGNSFSLDNLFYSRRIGRSPHYYPEVDSDNSEYAQVPENSTIIGALKLTGKTKNGLSVGIIESLTAKEEAEVVRQGVESKETVEPTTNYFIGRVQQDLNNTNTIIGGMLTSTNRFGDEDHLKYLNKNAYSGGLDLTQYWKNKTYYMKLVYATSHIYGDSTAMIAQQSSSRRYFQRPDNSYNSFDSTRTSLTGHAGTVQVGKSGSSKWRWVFWTTWRSPQFETNDVGFLHHADAIFQVFWIGYRFAEPFSIFRTMQVNFNQWTGWDFGYNSSFYGGNVNTYMEFTNHWWFNGGINFDGGGVSNTMLRGGPSIKYPASPNGWIGLGTDSRKKLQLNANASLIVGLENSSEYSSFSLSAVYRPYDALKLSLSPNINFSNNKLQYLTSEEFNNETRYIFSSIKQVTTSLTFRIDYTITPELTIQYYGSPFVSAVDYFDPKYITDPKAHKFDDRFSSDVSFSTDDFENGYDFNFRQFRSNLVARWEYRPGSLVYLVWTQSRTGSVDDGNFSFVNDMDGLFSIHPYNVFLVKFSYRFGN